MFPQRLQEEEEEGGEEEEEEEEEVSGLLNLLLLILVRLSWLEKKKQTNKQHGSLIKLPVRRYVTIYRVKPRGMAKVAQWKFILPYVSKVPEISFYDCL